MSSSSKSLPDGLTSCDLKGLEQAIKQAEKSLSEGGIPIGSVLLDKSGAVVSMGHNERVQTGDTTAHAEICCLRNAGRRRDWQECTLISTLSPCAMCTGAAVLHKIPKVVIGENQTFRGREDWLSAEGVEIFNVEDSQCIKLMKNFIRDRPDLWDEDIGIPPQSR